MSAQLSSFSSHSRKLPTHKPDRKREEESDEAPTGTAGEAGKLWTRPEILTIPMTLSDLQHDPKKRIRECRSRAALLEFGADDGTT
jgi:hypothetical protein